jgi:hypothetical protein
MRGSSSGSRCDPADLPQASYTPDIIGELDGEPSERDARLDSATGIRMAFALIAEHPRVDVGFWAYCVAHKLDVVAGRTCGEIALRLGVTEADFSKTVNYYCDLLDLPRPPSLKSQAARVAYSKVQRDNHWRDRTGADFVARHRKRADPVGSQ